MGYQDGPNPYETELAAFKLGQRSAPEEGQLTVDIFQTDDDIVIKSTIAGVKPEDLDVSVSNDTITIKGARKMEERIRDGDFLHRELHWGTFSRSIILPEDIDPDTSKASLVNGVLTLRLPKMSRKKIKKLKVGA